MGKEMESIDVLKELMKFRERLDRYEGGVSAMVLKDQEDDKKLEEISRLKSELEQLKSADKSNNNEILDVKYYIERNISQINNQLGDLSSRLGAIEKLTTAVSSLTPRLGLLEKNIQDVYTVLGVMKTRISELDAAQMDDRGSLSSQIAKMQKCVKDDVASKLTGLVNEKDLKASIEKIIKQFQDSDAQMFAMLDSYVKENQISKTKLEDHKKDTEQFKKNVAERISLAFETFSKQIHADIQPIKESGLKRQLDVLKTDLDNLKTEDDLKAHKSDLFERQIDGLNKKLEKVFVLLKKLELDKDKG